MKNNSALPSQKNKKQKPFTVSVFVCVRERNAATPALQCVFQKEILRLGFLHFIFQFTAPSRGKALSVDFFSLPSTANIEQPK